MRLLREIIKARTYDSKKDNLPSLRIQDPGKGTAKSGKEGFIGLIL